MGTMTVRHVVEPLSRVRCRAVEPDSKLYSSVIDGAKVAISPRLGQWKEMEIVKWGKLMERDMQFLKDCRGTVLTTPNTR